MIRRVYLSGPMTGLPENNYPAFGAAAQWLRSMMFEVYNPAEWEKHHNKGVFNLEIAFADYCHFICREAEAVVVLPGWENSPGARAEAAVARALGKPVLAFGDGSLPLREVESV